MYGYEVLLTWAVSFSVSMQNNVGCGEFVCFIRDGGG
jgi:hypothetical protein